MKAVFITESLSGEQQYSIEFVNQLLDKKLEKNLERGTDFTGRLTTNIYANDHYVVKIKSYCGCSEKTTKKWIEERLKLERELQIYPNDKAWFLINIDGVIFPGNITSRLLPLHKVTHKDFPQGVTNFADLVASVCGISLKVAAKNNRLLDMGLSNFALASDGKIYYVDDDLYNWDRFLGFSQTFSSYLREQYGKGFDVSLLATSVRNDILTYFDNDESWLYVLDEHIKHTFIPDVMKSYFNIVHEIFKCGESQAIFSVDINRLTGKVAVLGDIHANIKALEAVMADMKTNDINQAIVVGDIVGYGPNPNECIELLRATNFLIIKGNHDYAAALGRACRGFSRSATWAIDWTIDKLTDSNKRWLKNLVPVIKADDFWVVHGAPRDPTFFNAYVYQMTYSKNLDFMEDNDISICFHGHTHIPGAYIRNQKNQDYHDTATTLALTPNIKCVLYCPGSVGQPRNQSTMAHYAIWDKSNNTIESREVEYDMQGVVNEMYKHNFPDFVRLHLEKQLLNKSG